MKKTFIKLITASLLITTLASCGGATLPSSSTTSSSSTVDSQSAPTVNTNKFGNLENIKKSGKLVMATSPDYAPYEFIDLNKMGKGQEQYAGLDIEVGKYIAEKLGVELEIKAMSFDAVITAVAEGTCDIAFSGLAPRDDRKTKMDFTNTYTTGTSGQGLLVLTKDADKYKEPADLSGKKVAYQNGSEQQGIAETQLPKDIVAKPIGKLTDGIMELQSGKIDALIISSTAGDIYAYRYDDLSMSTIIFDGTKGGVSGAIPKGSDEFLAEVNKIIAEINEQSLNKQWMESSKMLAAEMLS